MAVLLGTLLIAGCGASKSSSSASTATAPLTVPPISTTTPTTATETTVTLTQTTSTGAINVRVPARFTIRPNGSLTPPTITIPAHLRVELIVVSNGQSHRITLQRTTLTVHPGAKAEALIDNLRAGSYPLQIDGTKRATLTIGGAPGP